MTKKLIETNDDDKYWTTKSEWHDWYNKNKPIEREIKPIKLNDLVYIKVILSKVEDGVPVLTEYYKRGFKSVKTKERADLFTLRQAREFIEKHPSYIESSGKYKVSYEIESLRPY